MRKNIEPLILLMPRHLHAKIETTAKTDNRSISDEIIERLGSSFTVSQAYVTDTKIKAILLEHIDTLNAEIEHLKVELIICQGQESDTYHSFSARTLT